MKRLLLPCSHRAQQGQPAHEEGHFHPLYTKAGVTCSQVHFLRNLWCTTVTAGQHWGLLGKNSGCTRAR